jgi:hypothetical protein
MLFWCPEPRISDQPFNSKSGQWDGWADYLPFMRCYLISSFAFILSHYSRSFILLYSHGEKHKTIASQKIEVCPIIYKSAILYTPVTTFSQCMVQCTHFINGASISLMLKSSTVRIHGLGDSCIMIWPLEAILQECFSHRARRFVSTTRLQGDVLAYSARHSASWKTQFMLGFILSQQQPKRRKNYTFARTAWSPGERQREWLS